MKAKQILSTYVHVLDDGRSVAVPVSDSFWADLARGKHAELNQGRLMTAFTFSQPWPNWERHPAGEELVLLLTGEATLTLQLEDGEKDIVLDTPGAYVLVPPNTWHTAKTKVTTTMLFLTPGAGTDHRPVKAE
ncbi:MAG TPA: cupin domain-containing protein [Steroidobacter sp.]|uniref:cupin domain-containing protein n=1 Tax=Steroidobacter sp. TaxID=1978227 RepID=UPI002ED79F34